MTGMEPTRIECTVRRWRGKTLALVLLSKGIVKGGPNTGKPVLSVNVNNEEAVLLEADVLELMHGCLAFLESCQEER
jgi:hypothetical protein